MVSFGFKRSHPLVGITQRRLPRAPVPIEVGRHYEIDGALFRKRWGTITTEGRKVPHFPSKPRPTCIVMPPHFPSESVPHFARNPHGEIDPLHGKARSSSRPVGTVRNPRRHNKRK
jgi:hypothetical protein